MPNGIGIVKLMGRHAGFIAAHATLASGDVDLCLVPEVRDLCPRGSPIVCALFALSICQSQVSPRSYSPPSFSPLPSICLPGSH